MFPALAADAGIASVDSSVAFADAVVGLPAPTVGFADMSVGLQALDIGLAGAVGGAINTGTLRGTITAATEAEAFWGVGNITAGLAAAHAPLGFTTSANVALHTAVGCASSAMGGGQCGSGALAAGFGALYSDTVPQLPNNPIVNAAITGLGGGAGSALAGGRFGDGFAIAAAGYVFNCLGHLPCSDGTRPSDGVRPVYPLLNLGAMWAAFSTGLGELDLAAEEAGSILPSTLARVISGIVHVLKSGGRWIDAPAAYGPRKTLYNRFVRWAAKGVWVDVFHTLAAAGGPPAEVLIDSSAVKAHRSASGGKGGSGRRRSAARAAGARPRSTR